MKNTYNSEDGFYRAKGWRASGKDSRTKKMKDIKILGLTNCTDLIASESYYLRFVYYCGNKASSEGMASSRLLYR